MFEPVAPGVVRLGIVFVNVFALGEPGGPWLLVDAGIKGSAGYIRRAIERWFENRPRPEAILLTHGHFDHVGSARDLAREWDVPLYAHPLEVPYLTGRSDYPPRDPTMGGAMAQMSRLMPDHGYDFGDRVHTLPPDGGVPSLPGWRWLHTPGHTPGHVSLCREADGVLLAADAFATMNLDSWSAYFTRRRELSRPSPPSPSTGRPPERASRNSRTWNLKWLPPATGSPSPATASHRSCGASQKVSLRRGEGGTSAAHPWPTTRASRSSHRRCPIRMPEGSPEPR